MYMYTFTYSLKKTQLENKVVYVNCIPVVL